MFYRAGDKNAGLATQASRVLTILLQFSANKRSTAVTQRANLTIFSSIVAGFAKPKTPKITRLRPRIAFNERFLPWWYTARCGAAGTSAPLASDCGCAWLALGAGQARARSLSYSAGVRNGLLLCGAERCGAALQTSVRSNNMQRTGLFRWVSRPRVGVARTRGF